MMIPADFPFPEALPTLDAQLELLRQRRKPAVYVPHWSPGLGRIAEFPAETTPAGVVFYDHDRLCGIQIQTAVANGQLGAILGYGIDSKPADGDRAVTLLRGELEIVSVFSNAQSEPAVRAALAKLADPGDEIRTEDPIEVPRRRLRWWTNYAKA